MNRIRILPDQVANQIAAGEVIERPASVLKELVENAIDAQATSIQIEIKGGGKGLIRVNDNGHGMGRDDALLCIERHATSKIYESADIGSIHTLGFRGEAIPSIASVSRFRLVSRDENSPVGTELEINGGKLLAVKDAGCVVGTQIEVRNLFYNLPARRKFLRSDPTELGHLHHMFLVHAIAQPKIAWLLQQEGRAVHELPIALLKGNSFSEAILNRVRTLHGAQMVSQLVPVKLHREGLKMEGYIGKSGLSRSNRSELYCFVNNRPVDSRAIYYGLMEAYHGALMKGRYPVCFLFLEIDPTLVDVNIHPAKREVRFREDARVQGFVIEAVRKALGNSIGRGGPISPLNMNWSPAFRPHVPSTPTHSFSPVPQSQLTPQSEIFKPPISHSPPFQSVALPLPRQESTQLDPSEEKLCSIRILGVLANLYVIAVDAQGLIIVDQHAAHERILFEQMMVRLEKGEAPSQRLLLPQTVELSPKDAAELKGYLASLTKMGFSISEFGDRTFLVDAVPPFVHTDSLSQVIRAVLDELSEGGSQVNKGRFAEETVAKTVCRHAVKANDVLRLEELERMLIDLQACKNPLTCPHGRPTMLRLSEAELEKKFGRRPM
jgi:DNA mismatch repair protein MutL